MKTDKLQTKKEEILRKEWEDDIRSRPHTKLLKMLRQPDKYTPECLAFVKEVIIEKLLEVTSPEYKKKAKKTTRALFLATLKKMGCSYEIDKDDDTICFMFQGEYFYATASDDDPFVCVRDYNWAVVDMRNIDEVSRVRRSVNEANLRSFVTTGYAVDDDLVHLYVVSWSNFVFTVELGHLTSYLSHQLRRFFRARHTFEVSMNKLYEEEEEE